ncbi:nucleotide sugar dehydrogenase [Pseudoclavibacter sp. JAI123]|uniref:nucleotide sugar dehydrogenase n=1 Tax=Pseudoclavibacter sp. JAI123 TaxID=2723065 RepID=UPI0015CCC913|nr:nucleotide sugar dehydrogenase [Pseudoclavibacter sp. JAI123]NYF12062.1 nucleotide sugar dehydrogenase [Pseudoclavibacter sp. JAI123]
MTTLHPTPETTAVPASPEPIRITADAKPLDLPPVAERAEPAAIAPSSESAPAFDYDVAIVGLGYVGLPTALAYFAGGSRVLALDVSPRRLEIIRSEHADLLDSDRVRLSAALDDERFHLTDDEREVSRAAAVIVCVPTPVDGHLVPDLHLLTAASAMVVALARPGQLIMLTSTTYVGCTEDLLVAPLALRGLVVGDDVSVAFSAERINPGVDLFSQEVVPRVVGGATPKCLEAAVTLLSRYAGEVHRVSSLEVAEMTKLLENTFRAVNIALANEFADICASLRIPVTEVIDAAATKPYGFMPFYPGPGVGGHCIPCDPHYLLWQLRKDRVEAPMITAAMASISARPGHVVQRIRDLLSEAGSGILGARILVIGVAYKPDVADLRESPALEILAALDGLGASLAYVDPHVPEVSLPSGRTLRSLDDPDAFEAGLVLVHTLHSGLDLAWLTSHTLVLDGTYRSADLPGRVLL